MNDRRRAGWLGRLEERIALEGTSPLPMALRMGLAFLAAVYRLLYSLVRLPYHLGLKRPIHPEVPVIAIGNLAVGGTGKTPFTIWLVKSLGRAGWRPAVIAHAYKAGKQAPVSVEAGASSGPRPEGTGDEAGLLMRACSGVPVVSGRDKLAAARLAVERFHPDVLVADDAFQHWRLARDLDLVLLDAAAPYGNGRLLPRGWLREPPSALRRADALILVGDSEGQTHDLQGKPIFHARTCPVSLTNYTEWCTGKQTPLGAVPGEAAVFCGLARPQRFLATLDALGVRVTDQLYLDDHALPDPAEFRAWAAGLASPVVITTEKDAIKLTRESLTILNAAGRELLVLGVELRPSDEEGLLTFILDRLETLPN